MPSKSTTPRRDRGPSFGWSPGGFAKSERSKLGKKKSHGIIPQQHESMGQRWSKKYGRVQRFSFLGDRIDNLTHTQMPSAIIDPWVDKPITRKYIHTSESTRYINPTYQIYSNIFKYHVRSVKLSLLQKFNTFPPFSTHRCISLCP